jgi:hypothetical protein
MDYLVTFVGHIREDIRPKHKLMDQGFPNDDYPQIVLMNHPVRAEDTDRLFGVVTALMGEITKDQGLMAMKDPYKTERVGEFNNNRMFVPMTMMTHVEAHVRALSSEVPMFSKGKTMLGDGTQVVVQ